MFKSRFKQLFFISSLLFLSLSSAGIIAAVPNQTSLEDKSPIKIGSSTALTETNANLGKGITKGIEIYLNKVNSAGGIDGRKIEFIVLDDRYEPVVAGQNVRQLIEKDNVLALIGNAGSPTAAITAPIANATKTLLFAPFSGSPILFKNPPDRYIINFQPSHAEVTQQAIKGLLANGIKPEQIAFFTQNDAFGDAIYNGSIKALKEAGYANPERLPYGRYNRNTLNVEAGIVSLMREATRNNATIKAIVMAAVGPPAKAFVAKAHTVFPNAIFVSIPAFYDDPDIQDKVVIGIREEPLLADKNLPAVQEFMKDMEKYGPIKEKDYFVFHGYLEAKLLVEALKRAAIAKNLTREGIIDAFETMKDLDIGMGVKISLDKTDHQVLRTGWPILMKNNEAYVPFEWSNLSKVMKKAQ